MKKEVPGGVTKKRAQFYQNCDLDNEKFSFYAQDFQIEVGEIYSIFCTLAIFQLPFGEYK